TLTEHSVAHVSSMVKAQKTYVPSPKSKPTTGVLFTTTAKNILASYTNVSGIAKIVLPNSVNSATPAKQKQSDQQAKTLEQQRQGTSDLAKNINDVTSHEVPALVAQMRTMSNFSNVL